MTNATHMLDRARDANKGVTANILLPRIAAAVLDARSFSAAFAVSAFAASAAQTRVIKHTKCTAIHKKKTGQPTCDAPMANLR
jgi:hypothetical protein